MRVGENKHEIAQFVVDIRALSQSLGDFEPHGLAEPLAQSVDSHFYGGLAPPELYGDICLGKPVRIANEPWF